MENITLDKTNQDVEPTKTEVSFKDEELKDNLEKIFENENSPEVPSETPSESVEIKTEDANTTNCLALTIQEDHKLIAIKNVFLRSIRMSWKVVVSAVTLALIKLFS